MIFKVICYRSFPVIVLVIWLSIFHISDAAENPDAAKVVDEIEFYLLVGFEGAVNLSEKKSGPDETEIIIELLKYPDNANFSHVNGTSFQLTSQKKFSQWGSWKKEASLLRLSLTSIFQKLSATPLSDWYNNSGLSSKENFLEDDWKAIYNYISNNNFRTFQRDKIKLKCLHFTRASLPVEISNKIAYQQYSALIPPEVIHFVLKTNNTAGETGSKIQYSSSTNFLEPVPLYSKNGFHIEILQHNVDDLFRINQVLISSMSGVYQHINFLQESNNYVDYILTKSVIAFEEALGKQYKTLSTINDKAEYIKKKVEIASNENQSFSVTPGLNIELLSENISEKIRPMVTLPNKQIAGDSSPPSQFLTYIFLAFIFATCLILLYFSVANSSAKNRQNHPSQNNGSRFTNTHSDSQIPNELMSIKRKIENIHKLFGLSTSDTGYTATKNYTNPSNISPIVHQIVTEIRLDRSHTNIDDTYENLNKFLQDLIPKILIQAMKSAVTQYSISISFSKEIEGFIKNLHEETSTIISSELNSFFNNFSSISEEHSEKLSKLLCHFNIIDHPHTQKPRQTLSSLQNHSHSPVISPGPKVKKTSPPPPPLSNEQIYNGINKAIQDANERLEHQNRIRLKQIHPHFFQIDKAIDAIKHLIPPLTSGVDIQDQKFISENPQFTNFIKEVTLLSQSWEATKFPFKITSQSIDSFSNKFHKETEKVILKVKQISAPSLNDQIARYCKTLLNDKLQEDINAAQYHQSTIGNEELIDKTKLIFKLLQRYQRDIESIYKKIPPIFILSKA